LCYTILNDKLGVCVLHMKPSIWSDYYGRLSPEEGLLALREAGFSCAELGIDHIRALRRRDADPEKIGLQLSRFLETEGFGLPAGHLDLQWELTDPLHLEELKKEVALFQAIGIKNAIIHINGGLHLPEEQRQDLQADHLRRLLDLMTGTDMTLCIENLRPNPSVADADKILLWIDRLGGQNLGICLDTGHLNVASNSLKTTAQTPGQFIRKAGSRLKHLHINGNDGTDDYHLAPFCIKNSVNWAEVITSLREIGYNGLFNLEVPGEIKGDPPMYILKRKLLYLKELADYMLSDNFPE